MYEEKNFTLKILITTATDYVLTFLLYVLEKIRLHFIWIDADEIQSLISEK